MSEPGATTEPRIMIVEPDILVRVPLAEYLRECGYQVVEVVSAEEARAVLTELSLPIDIVLADVDRAGEGFALAAWIRAHHRGVEVVLTGSLAMATEKAGALCEEGPTLTKPYDHQLLLNEIRRRLAARQRNDGEA